MPDELASASVNRQLAENRRRIHPARPNGLDQLPVLISTVHQALVARSKPAAEIGVEHTPAVSIRRSVHRDYPVCLECGWRGQMLRGHLATGDGLTVEQCRTRCKLSREHEMTAPGYFGEPIRTRDKARPYREESMKLCSLGLAAMLITSPVYADEAMTVLQDLGSKWQTAYNNGEPAKFADLYTEDAFFSSGVLGTLKGKPQIEKAIADQIKKTPKITVHPIAAQQSGNVVWGHGEFVFDDGPSGNYGITVVNNAGSWHIAMHVSNASPPKKQ